MRMPPGPICEHRRNAMKEILQARPKITAVIPAYNEEKTIGRIVEGVKKHVAEVLVVDDGSHDDTTRIAMDAGAKVVRIPTNQGKGIALSIGLNTAALNGSSVIVCLDGDGQHDPEDIPKLAEPIIHGRADMVIGSRFLDVHSRELIPAYRRIGQRILTIATNLGNSVKITDSQSGYRAFSRDSLAAFDYVESGMGIESEMVRNAVKRGLRIEEVPIVARYEGLDTSTLGPSNHGITVLGSIIRDISGERPLLYLGITGLFVTIVGIAFGLYTINFCLDSGALPFGTTTVAVMLAVVGTLVVLVGLILNAIRQMVVNSRNRRENNR